MDTAESRHPVAASRRESRIWLFVRMSLAYYRSHLVSLFMTLALPLVFLVVYAFAYFVSASPAQMTVGITPAAQTMMEERIQRLPPGIARAVPGADAQEMLRSGVQVVIDKDDATQNVVFYAMPPHLAIAKTLAWSLSAPATASTQAAQAFEVRAYSDPMSPLSFLPGVLLMSILNLALFTTGSKLLQERSQGTLRLFRMLPAPLWYFFGAELLGKLVLGMLQSIAFITLSVLLTGVALPLHAVAMALLVCLFSMLCLLSAGIALGSVLRTFSGGVHVFTIVNLVTVFFGDIFFPASDFPATKPLALLIPTTYCADLLRHFMLGYDLRFPWGLSLAYVAFFTAGCTAAAVKLFRFTARA